MFDTLLIIYKLSKREFVGIVHCTLFAYYKIKKIMSISLKNKQFLV